jgi:hypothetical protein
MTLFVYEFQVVLFVDVTIVVGVMHRESNHDTGVTPMPERHLAGTT